jgi:hypothetical protein
MLRTDENGNPFCKCNYETKNNLPITIRCMIPCNAQRDMVRMVRANPLLEIRNGKIHHIEPKAKV